MVQAVWDRKSSHNFDADFDCYIAEALLSEGRPFGTLDETLARYTVKTISELAEKQQELRVLAHLAREEALIKAFTENRDVHTLTASRLFNLPYEEVSSTTESSGEA